MASTARVLVIDDEESIRFGIRSYLETKGFKVEEASGCEDGESSFRRTPPDVALVDYSLGDGDALELMARLRAIQENVPFIVMTGHGSIDLAVRAIKEGAEQFLTKPVELATLELLLQRTLENHRNRRKQIVTKTRHGRGKIDPFLGRSAAITELKARAERVGDSDSPVLIQGETGSGKGVLAQWLHEQSSRADEPFVDLNCAGLSRDFLETELFGHERGAFTGASTSKVGLLELAHRGTVFLDEIGDMDLNVQPKLLKAIEEKRFRRLGDVKARQVDIRLIAAVQHDIKRLVREKKFRDDLYFRISTLPLVVPPLRERREDIPELASFLIGTVGKTAATLTDAALEALCNYDWPGNIRELRNVLERALLLSNGDVIDARDLLFDAALRNQEPTEAMTLQEVERQHIERVLSATMGHVGKTAAKLGIPRSSLYEKIKKYGISRSTDVAV